MIMKVGSFLWRKKFVSIPVIALLVWGGYTYMMNETTTTQTQYVTAQVENGTLIKAISGSGNLVVDQSAAVDPTISGTVSNLSVNVGDFVEKGQFLFTIENDDLNVSVAKAETSLQQAANSLESARLSVDQAKVDYEAVKDENIAVAKKNLVKNKLALARNGVIAAEKGYAATLADYNRQIETAHDRRVVSPIEGTVNEINVKNGDDLGASSSSTHQAPIIIGDLTTLKMQVQINEVDIPAISVGQKATFTFDALEELTLTGKVEKMDSLGTVTQGVVTYNVTLGLDTIDPRIKSGMSATADIVTEVKQDVIMVANGAVKTQKGEDFVEVLINGVPEQRFVEVGISNDTDTEIVSGLTTDDLVITQTILPSSSSATSTKTSQQGSSIRIPGLGGR